MFRQWWEKQRKKGDSATSPVDRADSHSKQGAAQRNDGRATQFPGPASRGDVELVIGLDFGTSCTKLVIQDVARRTGYAVPLARQHVGDEYLLPTKIWLDEDGLFNLEGRGREFRKLKENLMAYVRDSGSSDSKKPRTLIPHTIAYIALVLRATRAWFLHTHEETYGGRRIVWRVNVGMPASRFDEPHMPLFYRWLVRRGWALSAMDSRVTLALAARIQKAPKLRSSAPDRLLGAGAIGAFPEVVAAVQGYAKSPERQQGLHLLVDAGAGTLDVTCFRLLEYDAEDHFPIYTARIVPLGGFQLFAHRAARLPESLADALASMEAQLDGAAEPPDPLDLSDYVDDEQRAAIDNDFQNGIGESIWKVISETKSVRDPGAEEWRSELPTFLCGGAAGIPLYGGALKRIDENSGWMGSLRIRDLELPKVVEAPGLAPALRQRLLVAYGLSFNPFDIGTLIPASGIPDPEVEDQRKQYTEAFVGKEMV